MERRLAAILSADVVGYSRLMEADEAGTLERLKTLRADRFVKLQGLKSATHREMLLAALSVAGLPD